MADNKHTRLTEKILADKKAHNERQQQRDRERREKIQGLEYDPFEIGKWKVLIGPDPQYLPTTPMRATTTGLIISCKACGNPFESKGLAYCKACCDLPAKEREAMSPAVRGRMCQAPGCENPIPRSARADTRFCSHACAQRASRHARNVIDKASGLPNYVPPRNVIDNDKKDE